jgi:hypothetical protein
MGSLRQVQCLGGLSRQHLHPFVLIPTLCHDRAYRTNVSSFRSGYNFETGTKVKPAYIFQRSRGRLIFRRLALAAW